MRVSVFECGECMDLKFFAKKICLSWAIGLSNQNFMMVVEGGRQFKPIQRHLTAIWTPISKKLDEHGLAMSQLLVVRVVQIYN
mmetsp:Transcript_119654/g.211470  ORF Transcript_119654/g.211470 Transcript_119654/m.211470 type:complete len:83 (+) Transcript_119654:378-626(+)